MPRDVKVTCHKSSVRILAPFVIGLWGKALDYLVITHGDKVLERLVIDLWGEILETFVNNILGDFSLKLPIG